MINNKIIYIYKTENKLKDHQGNVQDAIEAMYMLKNRAPEGGSCSRFCFGKQEHKKGNKRKKENKQRHQRS